MAKLEYKDKKFTAHLDVEARSLKRKVKKGWAFHVWSGEILPGIMVDIWPVEGGPTSNADDPWKGIVEELNKHLVGVEILAEEP